jgi:hypothetical protein
MFNRAWMTLTAFLLTFVSISSFAEREKFKVGDDEFSLDVPKGWKVQRDFFFPVSIVSPENPEQQRTVLGITPSGEKDEKNIFENANKDITPFKQGREDWLASVEGKSISYDPYERLTWKGIEAAHVLGYRYELPDGRFYSQSYYILCNGRRFIHFKTLIAEKQESNDLKVLNQTIRTFQCDSSNKKANLRAQR